MFNCKTPFLTVNLRVYNNKSQRVNLTGLGPVQSSTGLWTVWFVGITKTIGCKRKLSSGRQDKSCSGQRKVFLEM